MELQALQQECLACRRCGLCETRHSVVFGQGAAHAEVMLVGEGPGANEDEQTAFCALLHALSQLLPDS